MMPANCRIFGYRAELVLTDDQGRRLHIDALTLRPDRDVLTADLAIVSFAISEATKREQWGDNQQPSPQRVGCWRVES